MTRRIFFAIVVAAVFALAARRAGAQQPSNSPWHFLVSGDSRNCGDVVMPAIAETARKNQVAFYWHLGDLRAIYNFDEDIQHQPEHITRPLTISDYEDIAWPDFIDSQIAPFGPIPFMLGIGNHEAIAPAKTRQDFLLQFADWLNTPMLRAQRLHDNPRDHRMKTYFHWVDRGVAFYNLDNATVEQFDTAQLLWLERVLAADQANPGITTIVLGMHEALPDSITTVHSMSDYSAGTESGRRVYADLLRVQNGSHRHVYLLASHSHFYMEGIFNSQYWRQHGGVLPGWIVGTAGAVRYALPEPHAGAKAAMTNVYGSLLATVAPNGEIRFDFQKLDETDIPAPVTAKYGKDFVHWCFVENTLAK